MLQQKKRFPVPRIDGPYVPVYRPSGDVYDGVDTDNFRHGRYYEKWIPNDFSVVRYRGAWHLAGITHPCPPGFVSAYEHDGNVHEAEFQLFHASAEGKSFEDVFREGAFRDEKKILYPAERPGERCEIWAPQLIELSGQIHVVYSPETMRHAVSDDFLHWTVLPPLFRCPGPYFRDPYVSRIDGMYYFVYTGGGSVCLRTSEDFQTWTEPVVLSSGFYGRCEPESPVLLKRDGVWYLFWSAYDGRNGSYDERTFVFAADAPEGLTDTVPVTMLRAHAPEIVLGEDGKDFILSVFYPENGVSAARLVWE